MSRVNSVKGSRERIRRWHFYSVQVKVKRCSSSWETQLRATGRRLSYGITYPSKKRWFSIYLPRKDGRLSVNQCYLSCRVITVIRCWLTNGGSAWRSTDVRSFTHTEQQLSWRDAADVMAQSHWTTADGVTVRWTQPWWRGWSEENSQTQVTVGRRLIHHSSRVDIVRRAHWTFHPQRYTHIHCIIWFNPLTTTVVIWV